MQVSTADIPSDWQVALEPFLPATAMGQVSVGLRRSYDAGDIIFPAREMIFEALRLTSWSAVKVVILGQDPYHKAGQAMGLSFSVPHGIKIPPSLRNIYKELATDTGCLVPHHGNLTSWAEQGVLLLNSVLTVVKGQPGAHRKLKWQEVTDAVITAISMQKVGVVFLLWGNYARGKAALIDRDRHLVLEAVHPSPLGRGGFFGCRHFSQSNDYLSAKGKTPIQWQIL